jgi:uncharacterized membrane protein
METARNPRKISFVALMGALGNVMFVVSQTIFRTGPIALDLSHIGTFIAAVYGGPMTGLMAGFIVGIGPGLYFGYLGGSLGLLGLVGLPIGKALTGLTVGYLAQILKIGNGKHPSPKVLFVTLVGYVPEALFTVLFFQTFVSVLLPNVAAYLVDQSGSMYPFIVSLMTKAWIEIALLSIFMGALVGNNGFNDFMGKVFPKPFIFSKLRAEKPD